MRWSSRVRLKSRIEEIGDCLFTISIVSTMKKKLLRSQKTTICWTLGHHFTQTRFQITPIWYYWRIVKSEIIVSSPIPSLSREMRSANKTCKRSFSLIFVLANFVDYWKWKYHFGRLDLAMRFWCLKKSEIQLKSKCRWKQINE